MPLSSGSSLRLGQPFSYGGRLFVPLVSVLTISHEMGGIGYCTPVALLIGEGGTWSFVSLDPDTTQECLGDLEPPGK